MTKWREYCPCCGSDKVRNQAEVDSQYGDVEARECGACGHVYTADHDDPVVIEVRGGVAHVRQGIEGGNVLIIDYDNKEE